MSAKGSLVMIICFLLLICYLKNFSNNVLILFNDLGKSSQILEAISILEFGLSKSKFNYTFKVLLIRLYFQIGVSQRALDIAATLDIKNIQFDSLSYLVTENLEIFGQISHPLRLLQTTLSIYDRNEIEVISHF
jgi:N-terminal acetyltransferase B complex non-catalytic subunit